MYNASILCCADKAVSELKGADSNVSSYRSGFSDLVFLVYFKWNMKHSALI